MAPPKIVSEFKAAFERLLKEGKEPRPVMAVIKRIAAAEDLVACLDLYCALYDPAKPPQQRGAAQYAKATGYALLIHATKLAGPVNRFGEMILAFPALAGTAETKASSPHVAYARRWAALDDNERNEIIQLADGALKRQRLEEASRRKLMLVLIDAYRRKEGSAPGSLDSLLRFDPGEAAKREVFAKMATACEIAAVAHNKRPVPKTAPALDALDAAFDAFGQYLDGFIQQPLDLLCALAWAREPRNDATYWSDTRTGRKQTLSTPWALVWQELYLEAAWRGQKLGITAWKIPGMEKARAYVGEDADFVVAPFSAHDRELLRSRLAHAARDAKDFRAISRGRRRAALAGRLKQLTLLDERQVVALSAAVKAAWEKAPADVASRFTYSPHIVLRRDHKYWINQSIADAFTVVWVEMDKPPAERPAIVEVHAMPGFLFRGLPGALSDLHDDAFFRELARSAMALAAFLLAYLQVLGYAFDIMTAGMSGGLRHIIFEFAKERLFEELTSKGLELAGIDNPWAQALVGFGVNFVPKPRLGGAPRAKDVLDAADAAAMGRAVDAPAIVRDPPRPRMDVPSGKPEPASRLTGAPTRGPHDADNVIFLAPGSGDAAATAAARKKFKDPSAERLTNTIETQAERLGSWLDGSPAGAIDVVPTSGGSAALRGPGQPMARIAGVRGTESARSNAVRATGGRGNPRPQSAAADRLRDSPLGKLLVEYDAFLEAAYKLEKTTARNQILDDLARGTIPYAKAEARLRKLLNDAREHTGEYVAAGVIYSNYKVKSAVSVPYRGGRSNVPILDQVFEITHKKWDFLFNEVKGGENTALGIVRRRIYRFEGNTLKWSYGGGTWIPQASGPWYYQRIAEIYMKGDAASRALAKKMLKAAREGRVGFAVTKSGQALDPDFDLTSSADVAKWFKKTKWDTKGDFPVPLQ